MKALVTGASGFIGGAIADGLIEAGWEVNVLARSQEAIQERIQRGGAPRLKQAQVFLANLAHPEVDLRPALRGVDVVYHAAAIRNRWGTTAQEYRSVNVEATRQLLNACAGKIRRFVYLSSVGVYGKPGVLHVDESFPIVPYSGKIGYHPTKAEAEGVTLAYRDEIEAVVVRPTITYGPGDWDGMLTRMIAMIARGTFVRVGRGDNHFHLTYIRDLVYGLLLAGAHPAAVGTTFLLAGPESIAVRDLVRQIEEQLGRPARKWYVPEGPARILAAGVETIYRYGASLGVSLFRSAPPLTGEKIDIVCAHRSFSWGRASRLLGYQPLVEYRDGVEQTIAWMAGVGLLPVEGRAANHPNSPAGVV